VEAWRKTWRSHMHARLLLTIRLEGRTSFQRMWRRVGD
jgi:hypothetical protein